MTSDEGLLDWRAALRAQRERRKLSRDEVARRSGLSLGAIKAYESGARHPSLASMNALIDAIGIAREEANPIRAAAGFAVDLESLLRERYIFDQANLREEIDAYPWPAFITNMAFDIVAANLAFERLWRVDLSQPATKVGERSFLARASEANLASRIVNYDEVLTFMIGLAKGDPRFAQNPERPAPWLRDAFATLFEGDPAYITRLMGLWESAPALPHRMRHLYSVVWNYVGGGVITFVGDLSIADIWNELSWNQWVPADVESWRLMKEVHDAESQASTSNARLRGSSPT